MPNKIKMKSLNLSGSQAQIVIKSLNERLYEFDEELDALESRIIEIRMKKSQLNNLLAELGENPASAEGPKKRGRKPGSGKKAAPEASAAPKKRGRKPGSGKKAAAETPAAAPKKRGRKPGVKATVAAPKAAPGKRGRKPGSKAAAPKKAAVKAAPKKAASKAAVKVAAPKAAPAKAEAAAKTPAKAAPAKKAETGGKRGRKSGGENTLAAKIVSAITDAKKGLTTREIVDSLNNRYGAEKDERKLIQAISSTLISLTKRGKIKRETGKDGQILNIVVS